MNGWSIVAALFAIVIIAPWLIAIRRWGSTRALRKVVDDDRTWAHDAIYALRGRAASKADVEALARRIDLVEKSAGALALRQIIDDDRAKVQALGQRVTAAEREIADINEALDAVVLETGETKMMEQSTMLPPPMSAPAANGEQAPPSTRRHGAGAGAHRGQPTASSDGVPASSRTMAGVGPAQR